MIGRSGPFCIFHRPKASVKRSVSHVHLNLGHFWMPVEADVPCFCKYLSACIVRWVREVDFDCHLCGCTAFKIPFHIAPDTLPLKELDAPQRSLLTCEHHAQRASYIVRVWRSEYTDTYVRNVRKGGEIGGATDDASGTYLAPTTALLF